MEKRESPSDPIVPLQYGPPENYPEDGPDIGPLKEDYLELRSRMYRQLKKDTNSLLETILCILTFVLSFYIIFNLGSL